jgi:hypothetical protein
MTLFQRGATSPRRVSHCAFLTVFESDACLFLPRKTPGRLQSRDRANSLMGRRSDRSSRHTRWRTRRRGAYRPSRRAAYADNSAGIRR